MKLLIALAAVAGLSGCVAYGGGTYGTAGVYYGNAAYPGYPVYGQPQYPHGYRDRDRDGDGVPDRRDAAPNNPRRY